MGVDLTPTLARGKILIQHRFHCPTGRFPSSAVVTRRQKERERMCKTRLDRRSTTRRGSFSGAPFFDSGGRSSVPGLRTLPPPTRTFPWGVSPELSGCPDRVWSRRRNTSRDSSPGSEDRMSLNLYYLRTRRCRDSQPTKQCPSSVDYGRGILWFRSGGPPGSGSLGTD